MLSCKASGELRGQCSVAQIVLWPVYAEAPVCPAFAQYGQFLPSMPSFCPVWPVYAAQSDSCKACKSPSRRLELQMDHQQWYCEVLRWCMVVVGISWYCTTLQHKLLSIAFQMDRLCSCHQAEGNVVGRPTRWSLLFIFGFLIWSSKSKYFPNPNNRYIV